MKMGRKNYGYRKNGKEDNWKEKSQKKRTVQVYQKDILIVLSDDAVIKTGQES